MEKEIIGTCQLLIVDKTRDITNEVTSGTRLNQVSRPGTKLWHGPCAA